MFLLSKTDLIMVILTKLTLSQSWGFDQTFFPLLSQLCYACNTCVVFVGVLHMYKYMCIPYGADTCVGYTPVLHR